MPVILRAVNKFEGDGFVETADGQLTYIGFPYTPDHRKPCTAERLSRMIRDGEFEGCDIEYPSLKIAVQAIRDFANDGHNPFEGESEETILARFNSIGVKNIEAIVDGIGRHISKGADHEGSLRALGRINSLISVVQDQGLREKVLKLRDVCLEAARKQ